MTESVDRFIKTVNELPNIYRNDLDLENEQVRY